MQNDLACPLSFLFFLGQFQLIDFSPCYGLFFPVSLYVWYFLVGYQMLNFALLGPRCFCVSFQNY